MPQKQNDAMNQAIDLLINNDTDISTIFKEDGLLKQLTKLVILPFLIAVESRELSCQS